MSNTQNCVTETAIASTSALRQRFRIDVFSGDLISTEAIMTPMLALVTGLAGYGLNYSLWAGMALSPTSHQGAEGTYFLS